MIINLMMLWQMLLSLMKTNFSSPKYSLCPLFAGGGSVIHQKHPHHRPEQSVDLYYHHKLYSTPCAYTYSSSSQSQMWLPPHNEVTDVCAIQLFSLSPFWTVTSFIIISKNQQIYDHSNLYYHHQLPKITYHRQFQYHCPPNDVTDVGANKPEFAAKIFSLSWQQNS